MDMKLYGLPRQGTNKKSRITFNIQSYISKKNVHFFFSIIFYLNEAVEKTIRPRDN